MYGLQLLCQCFRLSPFIAPNVVDHVPVISQQFQPGNGCDVRFRAWMSVPPPPKVFPDMSGVLPFVSVCSYFQIRDVVVTLVPCHDAAIVWIKVDVDDVQIKVFVDEIETAACLQTCDLLDPPNLFDAKRFRARGAEGIDVPRVTFAAIVFAHVLFAQNLCVCAVDVSVQVVLAQELFAALVTREIQLVAVPFFVPCQVATQCECLCAHSAFQSTAWVVRPCVRLESFAGLVKIGALGAAEKTRHCQKLKIAAQSD